jgi:hypothetical protein
MVLLVVFCHLRLAISLAAPANLIPIGYHTNELK